MELCCCFLQNVVDIGIISALRVSTLQSKSGYWLHRRVFLTEMCILSIATCAVYILSDDAHNVEGS